MTGVELSELELLRLDQSAWRREQRSHMDTQRIFAEEEREEQRARDLEMSGKIDSALQKLDHIRDRDMEPMLREVLKSVLEGKKEVDAADRQGYWNHKMTVFTVVAGAAGSVITWLLGKL